MRKNQAVTEETPAPVKRTRRIRAEMAEAADAVPAKKGPPPAPESMDAGGGATTHILTTFKPTAKAKQGRAPRGEALKMAMGELERLRQIETAQAEQLKYALGDVNRLTQEAVRHRSHTDSLAHQRYTLVKELAHSERARTAAEDALILFYQQLEAMHTNIMAFMTQWGISPEDHAVVWMRQQRERQIERRKRSAEADSCGTDGVAGSVVHEMRERGVNI